MLAATAMVLPKSSICSHVKGEVHERDCPSRGGSGQAGYLGACGGCARGGCQSLTADKFAAWCAQLPPGCLVALEACGGAHHWARKLRGYGLDARLIAGHFVTPYRMAGKGRKIGAADAAAICEAATRPHMRFVPVKPPAQTLLASHQLRKPPDSLTQLIPACLGTTM